MSHLPYLSFILNSPTRYTGSLPPHIVPYHSEYVFSPRYGHLVPMNTTIMCRNLHFPLAPGVSNTTANSPKSLYHEPCSYFIGILLHGASCLKGEVAVLPHEPTTAPGCLVPLEQSKVTSAMLLEQHPGCAQSLCRSALRVAAGPVLM